MSSTVFPPGTQFHGAQSPLNLVAQACVPGWDKSGKPGNQVSTNSLPSSEIFGRNLAFITIHVKLILKE